MKWSDEFWPLLLQYYMKKPEGVKTVYSRGMVDISLMLHIHPQELHRKMLELRHQNSPSIQQLWQDYANNPRKLTKAVKILCEKEGYGTAGRYYDGVDTNETFELDFRPVSDTCDIIPVQLIMVLDLYYQLTPTTMVKDTDEIIELSKRIKLSPATIVDIMEVYQMCDPYLNRTASHDHPLYEACHAIWNRYGNDDIEKLVAIAAQLKDYFS